MPSGFASDLAGYADTFEAFFRGRFRHEPTCRRHPERRRSRQRRPHRKTHTRRHRQKRLRRQRRQTSRLALRQPRRVRLRSSEKPCDNTCCRVTRHNQFTHRKGTPRGVPFLVTGFAARCAEKLCFSARLKLSSRLRRHTDRNLHCGIILRRSEPQTFQHENGVYIARTW